MSSPSSMLHPPSSFFGAARKWAGFVKLSHTVFALPFAVAAMAVAARGSHGLAGLAEVFADPGGDVLRADVRDGVQPDRGPGV